MVVWWGLFVGRFRTVLLLSSVLPGNPPLVLGPRPSRALRKRVLGKGIVSPAVLMNAWVTDTGISELLCWWIFGRGGYCQQRNDFIRKAARM